MKTKNSCSFFVIIFFQLFINFCFAGEFQLEVGGVKQKTGFLKCYICSTENCHKHIEEVNDQLEDSDLSQQQQEDLLAQLKSRYQFELLIKDLNKESTNTGEVVFFNKIDLSPGDYSSMCLHDENGNREADRMLGKVPKEPFGLSRMNTKDDLPVSMEIAPFKDTKFKVDEEHKNFRVQLLRLEMSDLNPFAETKIIDNPGFKESRYLSFIENIEHLNVLNKNKSYYCNN